MPRLVARRAPSIDLDDLDRARCAAMPVVPAAVRPVMALDPDAACALARVLDDDLTLDAPRGDHDKRKSCPKRYELSHGGGECNFRRRPRASLILAI